MALRFYYLELRQTEAHSSPVFKFSFCGFLFPLPSLDIFCLFTLAAATAVCEPDPVTSRVPLGQWTSSIDQSQRSLRWTRPADPATSTEQLLVPWRRGETAEESVIDGCIGVQNDKTGR